MIVCVCHRVSDRDIARAAQGGCTSFDELQFELSVATGCGKCHDCARETFHHHAALAAGSACRPGCTAAAPHGMSGPGTGQHHHEPIAAAMG